MERETIKVRVKLGGNWLSRVSDREISFSMEEMNACEFVTNPTDDYHHIHHLMRIFSIDNYKIVKVDE